MLERLALAAAVLLATQLNFCSPAQMALAEAVLAAIHHSFQNVEVDLVLPEGRPDLLLEVVHVPNLLRVHVVFYGAPEPKIYEEIFEEIFNPWAV